MTPGPYQVSWASSALRSLDRLSLKVSTACIEFVYGGLANNPHRVGRPLRFDLAGKHSARRGDFRVIYEIDDDRHEVTIVAIDHRSDVYRPRR
ncbi:MAG TPA: type II toxin-antitoxin system RelE/ParE family toxin [Acidimicrobiales bacterium]